MYVHKIRSLKNILYNGFRQYASCCPPQPPRCGCPPQIPGFGRRIVPPSDCRPGPVPPNPCMPKFPVKGKARKFRNLFFVVFFPLIVVQAIHALCHETEPKGDCRDYEYMRRRTKRFPWGRTGMKTLFHNPRTNHLPGECEPPPLDCD